MSKFFTTDYYLQYLEDIDALGRDVTDWEAEFLESILKNRPQNLSDKQKDIIARMTHKYLGEKIS